MAQDVTEQRNTKEKQLYLTSISKESIILDSDNSSCVVFLTKS